MYRPDNLRISALIVVAAAIIGCGRDSQAPIGRPDGDSSATWKSKSPSVKSPPETKTGPNAIVGPGPRVVIPMQIPENDGPRWDPNGIKDFELVERSGRKITRKNLLGKPFIAGFIFTSCRGPCANIMKEMFELQEWLKANDMDVRLVTLSVDPKRDTPEKLKRYAETFAADADRWWFLTGEQEVIYSLIQKSFLEMVREEVGAARLPGYEIAHTTGLMLVDKTGRVIGEYNAKYPQPMNDLRRRLTAWKKTGVFPKEETPKKKAAANKASKTPQVGGKP